MWNECGLSPFYINCKFSKQHFPGANWCITGQPNFNGGGTDSSICVHIRTNPHCNIPFAHSFLGCLLCLKIHLFSTVPDQQVEEQGHVQSQCHNQSPKLPFLPEIPVKHHHITWQPHYHLPQHIHDILLPLLCILCTDCTKWMHNDKIVFLISECTSNMVQLLDVIQVHLPNLSSKFWVLTTMYCDNDKEIIHYRPVHCNINYYMILNIKMINCHLEEFRYNDNLMIYK